jgi:CubicO group peptidase (beta-lactamase class C family)
MPLDRRSFLLAPALGLAAPAAFARRTAAPADAVAMRLPALDRIVADTLRKTGVPGMAVAVVSHDRVVYLKGFGVRRAGETGLVDPDTVFPLASLSKPLATTVIAGLVGDGIVAFDDKVVRHEPDFALSDPWVTREITLRDLLCHRSGLPDHAGDLLEDIGYPRAEVLHRLRYFAPLAPFRAS